MSMMFEDQRGRKSAELNVIARQVRPLPSFIKRSTPPQLVSNEWGSPDEVTLHARLRSQPFAAIVIVIQVWSLLCSKDDCHPRDSDVFEKNPDMTMDMRRVLVDWMQEV